MVEWIGYGLALFIGVSLGMIGGGGSVLTVPVLVYLMGVSPVAATAYSLFIVGSSSAVGCLRFAKMKLINYRIAALFGLPSLVAVFLTRKFLVPALPDTMIELGTFTVTKDVFLMSLFALLMLAASYSMIKGRKAANTGAVKSTGKMAFIILTEGLVVGVLTGLVGAGGGFLIIPALVVFANLKMKTAIGTSLLIISVKSLIGFTGDLSNLDIDWTLLLTFSTLAVAGIFVGSSIAKKVDGTKLKGVFGWFVLIMGIGILAKELFL